MDEALEALAALGPDEAALDTTDAEADAVAKSNVNVPRLSAWLRIVGLDDRASNLTTEGGVLVAWRDGVYLVRLVEALEGRQLNGVERQPRAAAHCRRNAEKALEAAGLSGGG